MPISMPKYSGCCTIKLAFTVAIKNPQALSGAGFRGFTGLFWSLLFIYLVELAGVEPASEIPTSSVLHA